MAPSFLQKIDPATLVELVLLVLGVIWIMRKPKRSKLELRLEGILQRISRSRLCPLAVAAFTFAGCWWGTSQIGHPAPAIHDEFSYLLAADTFASGRLANPPHAHWKHFETFHVLNQPTYSSKYPPAQGLVLALGQVISGDPAVGIWFGMAMACGALCWMLQAWLPSPWALVVSLLAALNFGFCGYWAQSYWGGAVAFAGSALVLGAIHRLDIDIKFGNAVTLGMGVLLLAMSRPVEGLIVVLLSGGFLLVRFIIRRAILTWEIFVKLILPCGFVLVIGACWMGYYNYRVTGSAWRFPYMEHMRQYPSASVFLGGASSTPDETVPPVFAAHQEALEESSTAGLHPFWYVKGKQLADAFAIYLRPVFIICLAGFIFVRKTAWDYLALAIVLLVTVLVSVERFSEARKLAPMTPALMFMVSSGLFHFSNIQEGRKLIFMKRLPYVICLSCAFASMASCILSYRLPPIRQLGRIRADMLGHLNQRPGKFLVFVRYGKDHNPYFEWVYNRADIDAAKVLWARELSPEQNRELLQSFSNRTALLLRPDMDPIQLVDYTPGDAGEAR